MKEAQRNMASQNSTIIKLTTDGDVESISSNRLSPTEKETELVINDEENDCDVEIPIYVGEVPRYVSGINRKTTCSDIIIALIDDELANTKVSKQLICEPKHYTIYEKFQDIEHALSGDELIFDLWNNWGHFRNTSDVHFGLKINKERHENADEKVKSKKIRNKGIKKLLKKVLYQGEMIQWHLKEMTKPEENHLQSDDEFLLVIESHNENDSGVCFSKEKHFFKQTVNDHSKDLSSTPKRKFRDLKSLKDHGINNFTTQDGFKGASFKFDLAHQELRTKMSDMKSIIAQEHSFLKKLNKCSFDDKLTFDDDLRSVCDTTMIV